MQTTISGRNIAATSGSAASTQGGGVERAASPTARGSSPSPSDRFAARAPQNPFASATHALGPIWKVARRDPRLSATVVASRPLMYTDGANPAADHPAIVRAGSGVVLFRTAEGPRLAVVQDDVSVIALVDPASGRVDPLLLPANADGERTFGEALGNKNKKMDLESATMVQVDGKQVLLAMGSGSLTNRESIVLAHVEDGYRVEVFEAHDFYAALRANTSFSGSELNIEGVTALDDGKLRLFQRGNGEASGNLRPLDSTADVSFAALLAHLRDPRARVPALEQIRNYDLGQVQGTKLTFADAAFAGGQCYFVGSAEASDSAINDGENMGAIIGVIDRKGEARIGVLRGEDGKPSRDKPEGITLDPEHPGRAYAVLDNDDPAAPARLLTLRLEGC